MINTINKRQFEIVALLPIEEWYVHDNFISSPHVGYTIIIYRDGKITFRKPGSSEYKPISLIKLKQFFKLKNFK